MAFSFPTSPTLNQQYTFGTKTWRYNGTGWVLVTGTDAAQSAWSTANLAYVNSNSATVLAQGAFDTANSKFDKVGGTITGNVYITKDLSIGGNLSVLGSTFSVNAGSIVANDSLIVLGLGNYTSDILDIGFAGHYNDGTNAHSGLIRDSGDKEWYLFKGYTPEINANNNIIVTHPSFRLDTLNANLRSNYIILNGFDLNSYINSAYYHANSSFIKANASFDTGNSAFIQANAAFTAANAATATDITQNNSITAAFNTANAAFITANASYNVLMVAYETQGTGACTTFSLGFKPYAANSIFVSVDGVLQSDTTYSVNSVANTITFTEAPASYESLRIVGFKQVNPYNIDDNTVEFQKLQSSVSATINTSFNTANAAFTAANAATATDITQNNSITAAFNTGNSAFIQANAAFTTGNSAFIQANAAFITANSAASTGKAIAMSIVFGG